MKTLSPPRWIAVPVAAVLALPGCQKKVDAGMDAAWWTLETERVELAQRVDLLKVKLAKAEPRHEDFDALEAKLEADVTRRALLVEKAAALELEVAALAEDVARERDEWIQTARGATLGRSFESFSGARGRTYKDVEITAVTDIGVEFKHASGSARLAAAELTQEQQREFGLDPGVAREALAEERAIARAYGSWVDERVARTTARREAAEAAEIAMAAAAPVRSRSQPVVAAVSSSRSSRLRENPRYFSRGTTIWYPTYTRGRYSYYDPYGSCGVPSPCVTTPRYPNIRVATSNWGYTPGRSSCNSPVIIKPRTSSFYNTP